ncbi:long-chain-fatty-acid--CoA ligase [Acinetobacter lwoffii]|uniref:Long-chain-fatty-acid--CoA ligase n=1 Tax=Acinetobacter lwoffii TaxID=28090 RepID=A0AAW8AUX5_ACILW|nr:long-chain-fatty-acid--CoA ligase [Acinetobacter lwoffii]MDP1370126.1 long-chain-fatty-acid--CoA ligase [Acinetobacter lwoffii]MDP1389597.1 long-chain-fatty-acid--CoA ligase [Acinetobacter lwoffii]MDP1447228.1 long-chain-fatty-acid--CoA ligase [Acinetobacter lwoffii]
MLGNMMFQPLLISSMIEHAGRYHADTEVISKNTDTSITVTNWGEIHQNSKRFANALQQLGLAQGDRVATIAWNNHRHLESWYAISGSGLVCHTINPRLFPEQLIFIINDAADRVVLFDKTFVPLIKAVKALLTSVEHFICLDAVDPAVREAIPEVQFYDDLIAGQNTEFEWPTLDENSASSLCYTSGTTGNPKGVLFSHRSTVLHSYAIILPDSLNVSAADIMLPVVPMFHVNAWGTPYAAAMVGCTLVLPGPGLDGASLVNLIDTYQVSVALGVPTIWQGLIAAANQSGSKLESLKRNVVGGSACPPAMLRAFKEQFNCETIHAWGMTEISPLGTANQLKTKHLHLSDEEKLQIRLSQGRPPFGVDLRLTDAEKGTHEIERDGQTTGNLQVKGHWVISHYFGKEESALTADGWFDTGDIATLDQDGFMKLSDRSKDLIKSGGEWISSVELENIAMGHPEIAMAAVIAAQHPKWDERPVLIAIKKPDSQLSEIDLLEYYADKVAKWQIPDRVVFVDAIPLSGTGKMLKKDLRELYGTILLEQAAG